MHIRWRREDHMRAGIPLRLIAQNPETGPIPVAAAHAAEGLHVLLGVIGTSYQAVAAGDSRMKSVGFTVSGCSDAFRRFGWLIRRWIRENTQWSPREAWCFIDDHLRNAPTRATRPGHTVFHRSLHRTRRAKHPHETIPG